jgi:DNA-binding GntR family transcriptional regulator
MPTPTALSAPAVVRDTLHTQVVGLLRQRLIDGSLAPGSKLNERVLCEEIGVSRTPLREAIKQLATEGLVTLEAGRGAFVAAPSRDDIEQTFDVIAVLEGLAAERAAQHITDAALAELQALQYDMQAAFERRDLQAYYAANARAHDLMSESAHNGVLRQTWQQLNQRLHALRYRSNQDETKWRRALAEHADMLLALRQRDGAALRLLLEEHLRRKRDAVLEQLDKT